MIALYILFGAELLVFAVSWHDQSPRSEKPAGHRVREPQRQPDPNLRQSNFS